MDLIYANAALEDIGILQSYKFDLAFGADENNFELTIPSVGHCCDGGYYLYINDTEYGGVVDSMTSDTVNQEVIYKGRTWHGILDSKVIIPEIGADYLELSGEANAVLRELIARTNSGELFTVSTEDSGIYIDGYQMPRYIAAYTGISQMLSGVGARLRFVFADGHVRLSAVLRVEYIEGEGLDSDLTPFVATKNYSPVNHLICLGRGELAEREVLHLYVGKDSTISDAPFFADMAERVAVYDNPNCESLSELRKEGIEQLTALMVSDTVDLQLDEANDVYNLYDMISISDHVTGLEASAVVTKKIVTISDGIVTISYTLGG